jgi:MEDS: MEthanogen/methylotroph, DcmR Sensory domain
MGESPGTHSLQLFDSQVSRATRIAGYVREGLELGGNVLVVATPTNWRSTAAILEHNGVSIDALVAAGRLTVLDAAQTLAQFMSGNTPDAEKLESVVGSLVARLAQQPGRLHIYGEMVDVLAEAGNYRGAHRLEELWNSLAEKTAFDLFCGYTSAHFGDQRTAQALKAICETHQRVHTSDTDDLGTFLVSQSANAVEDPNLPRRFTPSS